MQCRFFTGKQLPLQKQVRLLLLNGYFEETSSQLRTGGFPRILLAAARTPGVVCSTKTVVASGVFQ